MLLSTFEQKTAFSVIFNQKSAGNFPFLVSFLCILASLGAYLPPFNSLHHHPLPGHSPRE
jgi:hypothetical protein